MRWIKIIFWVVLLGLIGSFLHYTLPQTDIVRIVGTETKRIDFGQHSFFWSAPEGGVGDGQTRDVYFIQTERPNGKPLVYRNEDTAWGWPPYFKFNSADLQATAQGLVSSSEAPKWVAVQHYGWRNQFFTIFPNAIKLRVVSGPDATIIPWASLIILGLLLAFVLLIWRMFVQFRERMIDPMVDRVGDGFDELDARAKSRWARIKGFFQRKA